MYLLFTKVHVYLKGSMILKILMMSLLVYCSRTFKEFLKVPPWLFSSSQVADHSIVMVHWYGKLMTSMSFVLLFWYYQKCSHSTVYTWFGRRPMKFLKSGCDATMTWALSLNNDVINEVVSSLSSRRLSISLNTNVYMVESFSSEPGNNLALIHCIPSCLSPA